MCEEETEANLSQREFSMLTANSENEILEEFRKCKPVREKMFYFQILSQVKICIINGDISYLSKINTLLVGIREEVGEQKFLAYRCSHENPLRNVNIIILACKHSQPEILDFMLSDNCKILQHWPVTVDCNTVLLADIDEYNHNAFYYAIRSGKIKVVRVLIEKWTDPFKHSGNFYEVLSNAYRELKLKNVELPVEMEVFVREVLFEERFYENCETQEAKEPSKLDIEKRVELLLSNIATLTSEYSAIDVDETFLSIAKFTAKNIQILKKQLGSTYDKVPWEEMEFCLVIFILTVTECEENHLLHARVLCKNRILMQLANFANCLHNTQDFINQSIREQTKHYKNCNKMCKRCKKLQTLPTLNSIKDICKEVGINLQLREACVLSIVRINPLLKELYLDYDKVRDEYSLKTMKQYLDLAISVKCDEHGRLMIIRALQVVGEHLKKTLESPKLSDTTGDLLLFALPPNTREIVKDLRNSLSHSDSMSNRVKIENGEEEFFSRIKDDLKKLNSAIVQVLCQSKIRFIRDKLKKISESENVEKLKQILKPLHFENDEKDLSEVPILSQLRKLKILVQDLSLTIREKTQKEKTLFDKINLEINLEIDKLGNIIAVMETTLNWYNDFIDQSQHIKLENIKKVAKELLNNTDPEIEWPRLQNILTLLNKIVNCVTPKLDKKELDKVIDLQWKLIYSAQFELGKMKVIEEYKSNIKENKRKVYKKAQRDLNDIHQTKFIHSLFSQKMSHLKHVLHNEKFKSFTLFKNDIKTHVVVEMLLLDIYSLLEESMSYNDLFLDDEPLTLIGRNMRNHLAHGNTLIKILSAHSLIDLALNAKKISVYCTLNIKRIIGRVCRCNINKLQVEHEQDLGIVALQKEMFMAISNGYLEIVKKTLRKGADLKGKYIRCKTALHFASEGTSIETVKLLLEENCDIEAKDENGRNVLHIAARHGRSNIVEYLIKEKNISVDQLDKYRKTPLHIAAEHGQLEVVNILINSKASTAIQDVHGYSPLHYSVLNNHESIVKALVESEEDVIENEAFGGVTPLYIASMHGHLGLVQYLISKKANVNAVTDTLNVPLHAAVQKGHLKITRTLIASGAKVNARCMYGTTALHMICETGKESILELLLEHEIDVDDVINIWKRSPLTFAAKNGNLGIVKLLLKQEPKVDVKDGSGKTPLHFASENGHQSVVELLIKNKAPLEVTDQSGRTAMHFAALNGHTSIVCLLIERGSSIHCMDTCRDTPFNLAVFNGHLNVTEALIEAKADLNNMYITNFTALHTCCEKQFLEIAKLLIDSKADMHFPSLLFDITPFQLALGVCSKPMLEAFERGGAKVRDIKTGDFTALHLATMNGDLEIMKYLIGLNFDVNAQSKSGLTALHLAAKQQNMGAIVLLVENGSDLNVPDDNGHAPLYYAVKNNNMGIIQRMIKNGAIVKDEGYGEPLATAVVNGFHDVVNILMEKGKFDVNGHFRNNDSLLIASALFRHKKVAEILLHKGADIDARSNNSTPLHYASYNGDFEMVQLLLSKGANPNLTSFSEKITPLYTAIKEGHTDTVDILWQGGARNVDSTTRTALQHAIECNRVEVVKLLLEQKDVDVNENIGEQFSVLHIAASKNVLGIVKCLVEKGADINSIDFNGQTPIIIAATSGYKDIVEFFHKKFTAKANTFRGQLVLQLAVEKGHLEVTKYLAENCVDVNSSENNGKTFLHIAAKCNQKYIVSYFLNNGSYYNACDTSCETPLQVTKCSDIENALNLVKRFFLSIKRNELKLLEDAIKEGAILNAKRKDNATPLHYAAWKGYCDIVDALLKNGANPNIVGKGESTPLHYAAKYGHFDIVRSLLSHGAIYNVKSYNGKTPLDYSTQQDITDLLYLVIKCFQSVQDGNSKFLGNLRDPETIKAVMKSRNEENKLLVTFAMVNKFPKIKELKQVLEVDSNSMYAKATEHYICRRHSESLKLFKTILERRMEVLGCDHPDTLDIKDKIGEVLLNKNGSDLHEALTIFRENLITREESLGATDISTLHTKSFLGITLCTLGQFSEALKILQEIYKQQTIIFGKSHKHVLNTQFAIATILKQRGDDEEALALFSKVYELHKELNGESHPESVEMQAYIAMLLSKQKKYDEAIEKLQRLYGTQKHLLGVEHPSTLNILSIIAHVSHLKGNFNEALKLYKIVYRFQVIASISDSIPFLTTLHGIGEILFSQRKMLQAFKVFVECHSKSLEWMGPRHLLTQNAQKYMETIKSKFGIKYDLKSRCILAQVEKDSSNTTGGYRRSLEESIQEASNIYYQISKRLANNPPHIFTFEESTRNPEGLTSDDIIYNITEISRYRAIFDGDNNQGTETSTKYRDRDVFYWMTVFKAIHSGSHMKFYDIAST